VIILDEKIIRKNIGFDLSEEDQKLAYQILMTKRGKELSKFVSKAVIMSEYLQRRSQTDYILKRGGEILKESDGFLETQSSMKKKKRTTRKKETEETIPETTDFVKNTQEEPNVQITQTTQKEKIIPSVQQVDTQDKSQMTIMEEVTHPINRTENEPADISKQQSTAPAVDTVKDKTDETLEDDIFQQAMSFMSNF